MEQRIKEERRWDLGASAMEVGMAAGGGDDRDNTIGDEQMRNSRRRMRWE